MDNSMFLFILHKRKTQLPIDELSNVYKKAFKTLGWQKSSFLGNIIKPAYTIQTKFFEKVNRFTVCIKGNQVSQVK